MPPIQRPFGIARHGARAEIDVQAERKDHDDDDAAIMQGDGSPCCSPPARGATRVVQRACGRATKYSGKGVLHDLPRDDADLRRT